MSAHAGKISPKGIFVGLSTIDIIYAVSEHPMPNRKIAAESQQIFVGGPATNAAVTFAFLGGGTTLMTPTGLHPLAVLIQQECQKYGINLVDLTPDSKEPPPISSVSVDLEGQRSVVSANGAGRAIPDVVVDRALLNGARVVMVDGHAMQACQEWAEAAKSAGVRVVLDGGSWKPGTDLLLKNVDVAICSADFLTPGCKNDREVIEYLRAAGVHNIAITRGAAAIEYTSVSGSGVIEVQEVQSVDTTGAGDIFHGAFCFYYEASGEFEPALRKAAIIASESCRYPGTREWMRHLSISDQPFGAEST